MICPICKSETEENAESCKNCGAIFTKTDAQNVDSKSETEAETSSTEVTEPEETEAKETKENNTTEIKNTTRPSSRRELQNSKLKSKPEQTSANKKTPKKKVSKETKKYMALMKAVVFVCVAVMIALAAVSKTTVIFKNDDSDKTVVLSGLSESEKTSFEAFAPKLGIFFENGFDSSQTVFDDVLPKLNPSEKGGIYEAFFAQASTVIETEDPASRFLQGENGYYKIGSEQVSEIAKSLSLKALNDANTKDYYYYDGNYYFRFTNPENEAVKYTVKVADSKKTNDGDYYITCDIFRGSEEQAEKQLYFIASFEKINDSFSWAVSKISTEPIYSQLGSKLEKEEDENSLSFIMKRKTIQAKTESGKVYARYVIEYPSFKTDFMMKDAFESQFNTLIANFEKASKDADKKYTAYIKNGGNEADMPFFNHVVFSVKYNADGSFSMVERNTVYDTKTFAVDETAAEPQSVPLFPKTTFEAHNFEIKTGEFLKKDDLLGKDYQLIEQELFKTWYEAENGSTDSPVTDINSVGQKIYSSAWYFAKDEVCFLYQKDDGALYEVATKILNTSETAEN